MKNLFTGSDPVAAGASLEGEQNEFPIPNNAPDKTSSYIKGGYIYLEVAQATLTFKIQARFYNGIAWMKYHDLEDDDLTSVFDPTAAAVNCEFNLENQDFWKKPIRGIQVKYVRVTGSASAAISNDILEVHR